MNTITISDDCTHCAWCSKVCPANVFTITEKNTKPVVSSPESCIACGHCEAVCKDDAVQSEPFREIGETTPLADNTMSLLASLRSIRHYKKAALAQADIDELVQAGYNAPTAQNIREVKIDTYSAESIAEVNTIITKHLEKLIKLVRPALTSTISLFNREKGQSLATTMNKLKRVVAGVKADKYHFFHKAPHMIVLHAPKSNRFGKDDCDLALNYIRIAAHSKGLGTCIIGFAMTAKADIAKHLDLPKGHQIHGIISLGQPSVKYAKGITRKQRSIQ